MQSIIDLRSDEEEEDYDSMVTMNKRARLLQINKRKNEEDEAEMLLQPVANPVRPVKKMKMKKIVWKNDRLKRWVGGTSVQRAQPKSVRDKQDIEVNKWVRKLGAHRAKVKAESLAKRRGLGPSADRAAKRDAIIWERNAAQADLAEIARQAMMHPISPPDEMEYERDRERMIAEMQDQDRESEAMGMEDFNVAKRKKKAKKVQETNYLEYVDGNLYSMDPRKAGMGVIDLDKVDAVDPSPTKVAKRKEKTAEDYWAHMFDDEEFRAKKHALEMDEKAQIDFLDDGHALKELPRGKKAKFVKDKRKYATVLPTNYREMRTKKIRHDKIMPKTRKRTADEDYADWVHEAEMSAIESATNYHNWAQMARSGPKTVRNESLWTWDGGDEYTDEIKRRKKAGWGGRNYQLDHGFGTSALAMANPEAQAITPGEADWLDEEPLMIGDDAKEDENEFDVFADYDFDEHDFDDFEL